MLTSKEGRLFSLLKIESTLLAVLHRLIKVLFICHPLSKNIYAMTTGYVGLRWLIVEAI